MYPTIRKGDQGRRTSLQKRKAEEYHTLAGVSQSQPCNLLDIPLFEEVLDVEVIVFAAHLNNEVLYLDPTQPKRSHRVCLFYTKTNGEGHYDCMVNIKGMLSNSFFCELYLKSFNDIKKPQMWKHLPNLSLHFLEENQPHDV